MNPQHHLCLALLVIFVGCQTESNPVAPDVTPPGTVTDMTVTASEANSVTISWTAPGGDGAAGQAFAYEIRYGNTDIVTPEGWNQWAILQNPPTPQPPGRSEQLRVTNLATASEFIFGLRARDSAGNWSERSNAVTGRTPGYRTGPVLVAALKSEYPYATYSENGGRTWKAAAVQGQHPRLGWIMREPTSESTLYGLSPALDENLGGSGANRIWKSIDRGKTWSVLYDSFLYGSGCTALAVSPTVPGLMYVNVVGVCNESPYNNCFDGVGALYKSINGGTSWTLLTIPNRLSPISGYERYMVPFSHVVVDPRNGQQAYVGGRPWRFSRPDGSSLGFATLLATSDGGTTWHGFPFSGLIDVQIHRFGFHPSNPSIFISTARGIYRSFNAGSNWVNVSTTTTTALDFVFDPENPDRIYTPLVASSDAGQTWLTMTTPSGGQSAIALDPSRDDLYAAGTSGIFRSSDQGQTWTQILKDKHCSSIIVLPDLVSQR